MDCPKAIKNMTASSILKKIADIVGACFIVVKNSAANRRNAAAMISVPTQSPTGDSYGKGNGISNVRCK